MPRFLPLLALTALLFVSAIACGPAGAAPTATPGGCPILPVDNVWNTPIDQLPADSHSLEYVKNIGLNTGLHPDFGSGQYGDYGIPFNVVPQGHAKVPVSFDYDDESDPGPYPIPDSPKIEGGGDRHILVIEQGSCTLYETWASESNGQGGWHAGSGAIFNLRSNALRPDGWTSADAAGLPILPGLIRYDDVAASAINHALRFTVPCTASFYVWPARHQAVPSDCPATPPSGTRAPPMGLRFRLKASVDIAGFSHDTQVILAALKTYGMIVADNGSGWYLSGAPDTHWDDDTLVSELRQIHGSDFEAVDESSLQIGPGSGQARQPIQQSMGVSPGGARQGQPVSYSIQIGGDGGAVSLANQLPSGITLLSGPATVPATVAAATYDSATRTVSWSGAPASAAPVSISYTATIDSAATGPIANHATVTRASGAQPLVATLIANPIQGFVALMQR